MGAFLRTTRDETLWNWAQDPDLSKVDPDGIIFADTREDVELQFNARYPCPDPGLTFVAIYLDYGYSYGGATPQQQIRGGRVHVYDHPFYSGLYVDEVAELAERYGSVRTTFKIGENTWRHSSERRIPREDFVGTDCVPVDDEDWNHGVVVHFRPARCQAARKAAATRATQVGAAPEHLLQVYYAMREKLYAFDNCLFSYEVASYKSEADHRWAAVDAVETIIDLFTFVFGKHAYRRLKEFQDFKKEWKQRHLWSCRHYANCGNRRSWSGGPRRMGNFVDWMNYEITVRKPANMEIPWPSKPTAFAIPEKFDGQEVIDKLEEREKERKRKAQRKRRKPKRKKKGRSKAKKRNNADAQAVRSDEQAVPNSVQDGSDGILVPDEGVAVG